MNRVLIKEYAGYHFKFFTVFVHNFTKIYQNKKKSMAILNITPPQKIV